MYGLIKRAQNILINQLINNHCWPLAFSHDCMSVYVQNLVLQIDPMNMRPRRRSVRVNQACTKYSYQPTNKYPLLALIFSHNCMSVYVQNLVLQIDPMNMRLRRRSVRVDRTDGGPALHPSISSQLWTQPLTYLKLKLHINLHGTCISW